jgi:predicted permease
MRMERWPFTLPLRLKSLFMRGQADRELDEELQFHVDQKIDEGIAQGLSPEEARREALRAIGGVEQRKEEMRDTRGVHALTDFLDDVRYAVRSLRRASRLTMFVAVTLAMGIGMASAAFSMLDALIFRPYPVPRPRTVVTLVSTSHDNTSDLFSYREYLDIRANTKSYDGVIANATLSAVGFTAEPGSVPRVKGGMMVSGDYFHVLGVEPQLGRAFRPDEDQVPGRDAVVVLGPDVWKNDFASDPNVLGKTIRLNGRNFTVIGVAPESFPGMLVFSRPDFYMPIAMAPVFSTDRQKNFFDDRDDRELSVKARLKRGTTLAQARSELAVLAKAFERDYPELNRHRGAMVRTQLEMRTQADDLNWKFGVIFLLLAIGVLLVACTNVAGLLLSRARSRTREIAVRLTLGAGRFRLVRLLLTESLILALLGGLGGIVVGYSVIALFGTFRIPTELPVTIPFRMDTRVLLASLGFSLASAILCGLAPALQSTRTDLVTGLKSKDIDPPGQRLWGRSALVVAQVSLSLMLLMATYLMARDFKNSALQGTGFAKDHLLMARFDPRLVQYDPTQTQQFYEQLTARMRETPGVLNAGLTQNPPLGLDAFDRVDFVPEGFDMPRDRAMFSSMMDEVDEGYFATMGISIVRGRAFLGTDDADAPRVAIVNDRFAEHYWPGADPVGKRIRIGGAAGVPVEIVGVAQTVKYVETSEKSTEFMYMPLGQHPVARMVLLLRTSGDPVALVQPVKDVVHALEPNLPVSEMRTYEELYRYSTVEGPRFAIELIGTMGVVAFILSIAGLYGLVAYNVSRRTHEIGIRMAVGARPSDVLRLVMSKGLTLVAIGTIIGLALGLAVEKLIDSMLFNVGGVDLVAYAVVVPSMFLATLLAAYVPARRASLIEPTEALRYE